MPFLRVFTLVLSLSQNHRMVGVGRDLCGSCSPTLLPKQGHLQQAAQDLVQVGLEYLQRRRLHSLPGQPGPGLHHPQREEVLPHVQMENPCEICNIYVVSATHVTLPSEFIVERYWGAAGELLLDRKRLLAWKVCIMIR